MTRRLRIAALALVLAALAVVPAGTELRAQTPDSASLTALTVTPGSLDPAFSSTGTSYTVALAHDVDQITIVATPAGAGTVAFTQPGLSGTTPIPDADPNTDGQQVDFVGPSTVILVVVTEVGHTEASYTVTVTREEAPLVARDRAALMALYNSTGGASWTDRTNWGSSRPLDEWYNVNTDADGRVTYLALWGNNLRGTLPAELGNLDQLTELPLQDNHLTGSIPDLGRLTNLTLLRMWNNQLTGEIPASLSNLTKLRYLELRDNQLTGPIPDLRRNTGLVFVDLHGNQLSGNIPSMSGLDQLVDLHLNDNLLSGPIPDLSGLTSLERLYLERNQLTGEIPPSLDSLTSLLNLYLHENKLTGEIPASLGNFADLTQLFLWGNQLTGEIPASLGNLTTLRQLSLSRNQLTGQIPASLGNLTNLRYLYLNDNQLSGPIPDLSRLTNLLTLYLWENRLDGRVPDWLGNLTTLQSLILNGNRLSGEIPDLSRLTNLYYLYLNNNQLSGDIPDWLGNLTNLYYLYLYDNQLSGEIPASLDNLANLQQLLLNQNQLSGTIPDLRSLTNLTHLTFANNQLDGPIPDWVGSLTNLQRLWLSENQLSGMIPSTLGSLTNLQQLSLRNNQLDGPIPDSLGGLTDLLLLYLSNNQLSGEIPASLGSFPSLALARFAENELTGCVPHGLRDLVDAEQDEPAVPAHGFGFHDFIAVDANRDGDTDDAGDTPGLNLPFCMLSALALSDGTLVPAFAAGTADYTADMATTVESTTVTATLHDAGDRVSIRKGTRAYTSGEDAVPLGVGSNVISIEVTPSDARLLKQTYTVQVFREGSVESDRAALVALYNSAGGSGWTDNTNWNDPNADLDTWFGVTTGSGRVTVLELPGNNLRGTLPAELGSLTSLNVLDLSGNQLRGQIPDVRGLTILTTLNLGDNQLSGAIPDWLGSLTALQTLYLRDNRLTGPIPEALGDLVQLQDLYVDDNQISGAIPDWLSDLGQLRNLYLNGNQLSGCVPDELRPRLMTNHDFIAVDANGDGDTTDPGDTPGLPFCTLNSLDFGDVTLNPEFTSSRTTYTASAAHDVATTTVTAPLNNPSNTVSIIKGAVTYQDGDAVALDVGPNVITIEVTRPDDPLTPHTYTVTVMRQPNAPPAFDEGAVATRGVDENTAAGMDIGAPVAATDTENDTLTYSLDATGAESFDIDASSGQLQTKAALDYETRDSYRVTLSVRDSKDNNGGADEVTDDTITVTILVSNVNEAPAFPSAADSRTIPENTPVGGDVGAPFTATDGDNDTLTYSLDATGATYFDIDAASGQLRTRVALDFEGLDTSYSLTVTAADPSNASASVDVTITVTNADEAGTVTLSKVQPLVGQELMATVTDPDYVAGNETWSWESSSNRSSWTTIDGADSEYYIPVVGDEGRYLRATASYDDDEGMGKSAQAVSLNPVRMAVSGNTDPQFDSNVTGDRNVDENTPAGVDIGEPVAATDADDDPLTYTLDDGAEFFDIVPTTGQLQTKAALDYEDTDADNPYSVKVTATDTSGADYITGQIAIYVNNVEEPGTVTLSSLQPLVAIPLTATLDDPDGVSGSVTWSWARSPNGASDWTLISGASDSYTPAASDVGDYLRATASYNDGQGGGKSAQTISANAAAAAPGRNAPVLREYPTATRSVTRNTPAGRNIGAPLSATDADNDALTYRLGGPDEASFDIDASSGQLLTKAVLTGITRTSYKVFVSVSDGKDDEGNPEPDPQIDATTEVTISVTTPRRGGGGGGGGGFGGPILTVTTAVVGEAPANLSFGFAYTCANTRGELLSTRTFTVAAGRTFGLLVAAGLSCSLAVSDDGGATAVDGLFTDVVIQPAGYRTTVTFTFGPAPTTVDPDAKTVVEEAGVSLTIPEGSRDAPYAVLLEADGENCDGALGIEGEVIACFTVTVFDGEGAEETGVTLLVPATITITLDPARVEELGGIEGVRAARERGELRMLQRDDAESPWRELPFTVEETADGGVEIVVTVQAFSDFSLITSTPRTQTVALHADWNVVVWDGADGASIPDALGDIAGQVDVIYQWLAETQTWRSHRPAGPPILSAFDTFTRGATYWIRSSEAVEWTVVGGPLEPTTTEPIRLHHRWTEVVWRGADGALITEALGPDLLPQVEVIYRWLAETQSWGSFRPGAPAFLNAFDTFASGGSYWIAVAEGVEWTVAGDGG